MPDVFLSAAASQCVGGASGDPFFILSDLTPYATDDPNSTLVSGTVIDGTFAAGALQTHRQGVASFYELPDSIDGLPFDPSIITELFVADLNPIVIDTVTEGLVYGVGMALSDGNAGTGPNGAPATMAEVTRFAFGFVADRGRDPGLIRRTDVIQIDATGNSGTPHFRDRYFATAIPGASREGLLRATSTTTLNSDYELVAGSSVNRNTDGIFASDGDYISLVAMVWRIAALPSDLAQQYDAEIRYAQAGMHQ